MRTAIRHKASTARLVFEFHALHPDPHPASMASVLRLSAHLDQVTELEGDQQRQQGLARAGMEERVEAEEGLRRCYDQFVRLCRVVATQARVPELHLPLRISTRTTATLLLEVEQAIHLVEVHALVLQHFGLPSALPAEIERCLAAYHDAEGRRRAALEESIALTPAIEEAVEAAAVVVRHLDALNRIRYARDPEMLQRWSWVRRGGESRQQTGDSHQPSAVSN